MGILNELLSVRADFIEEDRHDAVKKIARRLYYEVAPRVASGDSFALFNTENDVANFCKNNNLDIRAVKWLIEAMRAEGLISAEKMPVILTPLAVEKLCVN